MNRFSLLIFFTGFFLAACQPAAPREIRAGISGSKAHRVSEAVRILSKYGTLPGTILDAQMEERVHDNSGGRIPGPSDSSLTGLFVIRTSQLESWRKFLGNKISSRPDTTLVEPPSWWPVSGDFSNTEFYEIQKLTGKVDGFVALFPSGTPETKIAFHAFTR